MLDDYAKNIADIKPVEIMSLLEKYSDDTDDIPDKTPVRICGIVSGRTDKNTKNGDAMAFVTLEDRYASIEALIFPKVLGKYGYLLTKDSAVALYGTLSKREEEDVKLLADAVLPLTVNAKYVNKAESQPKAKLTLYIKVQSMDSYGCTKAKQYLDVYSDENSDAAVRIYDMSAGKYYGRDVPVTLTAGLIFRLKKLLGADAVILK